MSDESERWTIRAGYWLRWWLIAASVLIGFAVLEQPAAGEDGLDDGPVLVMTSGTPEKVARALRGERLAPAKATVVSRLLDEEGLRRYTITCPLPSGDKRGKTYTITTSSYLRPSEFERRLYARD